MEQFATVAFEILDKNALTEILKRLEPIDVLRLCQINHHFARVCSDQTIFRILMKTHYPDFPINNNAKDQYMAITSEEVTDYSIGYDFNDTGSSDIKDSDNNIVPIFYHFDDVIFPKQDSDNEIINDTFKYHKNVEISGNILDSGSEIWISISGGENDIMNQIYTTSSKESTIDIVLNIFFDDQINILRQENDPDISIEELKAIINSTDVVNYLQENDIYYSFTREGMAKYLEDNNFLILLGATVQLIKVTIS